MPVDAPSLPEESGNVPALEDGVSDVAEEVMRVPARTADSIRKAETILAEADEETKAAVRRGDISIHAAHQKVRPPKPKAEPEYEEVEGDDDLFLGDEPEGLAAPALRDLPPRPEVAAGGRGRTRTFKDDEERRAAIDRVTRQISNLHAAFANSTFAEQLLAEIEGRVRQIRTLAEIAGK